MSGPGLHHRLACSLKRGADNSHKRSRAIGAAVLDNLRARAPERLIVGRATDSPPSLRLAFLPILLALSACSNEQRILDADQPVTDLVGPGDARMGQFFGNAWQVAQGGRYFAWYGCTGCHGGATRGRLDLGDPRRQGIPADRLYAAIAGHGPLGARIQPEQRWQLTAYVAQLPALDPALRRRQDKDETGEGEAGTWAGPVL